MKLLANVKLFFVAVFISSFCNMYADKKVALIIGNDDYPDSRYGSLRTCINDADRMDFVLKSIGFTTYIAKDCDQKEMSKTFSEFSKSSKNADVAVFFYSGHAKNIGGESYMIPGKTIFGSEIQRSDLVSVADIRDIMEKNSRLSLIFLDACRDGAYTRVKGTTKGERIMPTVTSSNNKPVGSMVFYATQFGDKATVGDGILSPFTKVLSEHLTDGDEFMTVWRNIKEQVPAESSGQNPDEEGFYTNGFWFNPVGSRLVAPPANPINKPNKYKYITINTNIPKAKINIYGSTFTSGSPIPCEIGKNYVFTITESGYQPFSGKIQVDTSPEIIDVKLAKAEYAEVKIYTNTEAAVYLDNKLVGISYPTNPLVVETQSGKRNIELKANGYYSSKKSEYIDAGKNSLYFNLPRDYPPFWSWDGDIQGTQYISYHFSPNYQLGLNYLYRPEDSRISYGLYLSGSTGLFKGVRMIELYSYSYVGTDITYSVDENGTLVKYRETSSLVSDKPIDKYSEDIDPDHEAKKYDANALILANFGFNPCNGILIEAGLGAGYHQDRYYLPYTSYMTKTVTTNLNTGTIVGEPQYGYIRGGGDKWFKQDSKWSPAFRLGAKALIPLGGWDTSFLTLGGGYTFQFTNMKYSSWDATIGFAWTF